MASTSNAIRMLGKLSKHADEVVEAGMKNLSEGNIIKATTTQLSSNMTNKQKQVVARIGREAAENARNTGRRAADDVVNSRTANRAVNRINNTPTAFDEMAATFDKGGGSRGRSGNGGYNNNARRRVEARRVNANNASQQVINHNTTQNAVDNVNANNRSTRRRNRNVNNTVNTNTTPTTPINVMSNDSYNDLMNQVGGPTYDPKARSIEKANRALNNGRVPLDYQGEMGQIERSLGGRQGTIHLPDTVPMEISGDMRAIEDMTGTKFKTKTIKGNAPRTNTNTNTPPNTNTGGTIINFNKEDVVPLEFSGDINQIERTMGGKFKPIEIPDTRTPNFENTNYMNINQQTQTSTPQFQSNPFNRNMNILQNQQQQTQKTIGMGQPRIGFDSSMKTSIPQMDMSKVKNLGDIDNIKDVDALNTMLNADTRAPIDMAKAWSSIKDFGNEYMIGGIRDTITGMQSGKGFQDAIKGAFTDADNNIRWGRVAGTYVTASAGLRLLSGGGLTRDRNGNPNMIGVPFI